MTVFGPVIVKLLPLTYEAFKELACVVSFVKLHPYVAVEVNAGLIPVMVAVEGDPLDNATRPKIMRLEPFDVLAQAVVVPQE